MGNNKTTSFGCSVNYGLFKQKLFTSLNITYSIESGVSDYTQFLGNLSLMYYTDKIGQFNLYLYLNTYNYAVMSNNKDSKSSGLTFQYNLNF